MKQDLAVKNGPLKQEKQLRSRAFAALGCFILGMVGAVFSPVISVIGFGGFAVCVIGGIVAGQLMHARWRAELAVQDYDSYRAEYPDMITGEGSVKCAKCQSPRIHVRGLMRRSYFREHFCAQCGAALYYTPEARE